MPIQPTDRPLQQALKGIIVSTGTEHKTLGQGVAYGLERRVRIRMQYGAHQAREMAKLRKRTPRASKGLPGSIQA